LSPTDCVENGTKKIDSLRRYEITDLLARLRILLDPADSGTLQKLFTRPDLLQNRSITRNLVSNDIGTGL
jgi:hypothetical protein